MLLRLVFDNPRPSYTNLDVISGRVILKVSSNSVVSSITVKLEGESKTRLLAPGLIEHEKQRPVAELHKVRRTSLYALVPEQI